MKKRQQNNGMSKIRHSDHGLTAKSYKHRGNPNKFPLLWEKESKIDSIRECVFWGKIAEQKIQTEFFLEVKLI